MRKRKNRVRGLYKLSIYSVGSRHLLKGKQGGNKGKRNQCKKRAAFKKNGIHTNFPCYVTNYHEFSSLETIYTQLPWSATWHRLVDHLLRVSQG